MTQTLFARKSIETVLQEHAAGTHLRRSLGPFELVSLGVAGVIGAGIFVLAGIVAKEAGPSVILSFILAGIACSFTALCYAELGALIPSAGSAYSYAYVALGEGIAWLIGWNQILRYTMAASFIASGWSGYAIGVLKSIGIYLPAWLSNDPWSIEGGLIDLPATLLVVIITILALWGTQKSARVTQVIVLIEVATLVGVILLGSRFVDPAHWDPFAPFGAWGVVNAMALVFLAYAGFECVSTVAEETRQPQRDLPIGMLGALATAIVLYTGVAVVLTGIVPFQQIDPRQPLADAFGKVGLDVVAKIIAGTAMAALTTCALATMIAQPRIVLAMARDGLLPRWTARVSPRFGTPVVTTLLFGTVMAFAAAFVPIELLAYFNCINELTLYALVCLCALVLRRQQPNLPRPYRMPLFPWVPLLGMLVCFALMLRLKMEVWILFFVWMGLGLAVYFAYSRRHSHAQQSGVKSSI